MARVTIEFDTENETLMDVVKRIGAETSVVDYDEPVELAPDKGQEGWALVPDQPDNPTPDLPDPSLWPGDGKDPEPELDSAGVPHDERIHSKEPTQNKDGTWKKRRGVSAEDYERITAELTADPVSVPAAPEPAATVPAAPATTVPAAPAPAVELTWPEANAKLQAFVAGNPKNGAEMLAALKEFNVEGYPLLSTRPDVWQPLIDKLGIQ